jgi:hypothetical protein
MKKGPPLTLDEHRRVGATLIMIRHECSAVELINQFRKGSHTWRRIQRTRKCFDQLLCQLDSLLCREHPGADFRIYYGNPIGSWQQRSMEDLREHMTHPVLDIINGRVPVRILDLWLKADCALSRLMITLEDSAPDIRVLNLVSQPRATTTATTTNPKGLDR